MKACEQVTQFTTFEVDGFRYTLELGWGERQELATGHLSRLRRAPKAQENASIPAIAGTCQPLGASLTQAACQPLGASPMPACQPLGASSTHACQPLGASPTQACQPLGANS